MFDVRVDYTDGTFEVLTVSADSYESAKEAAASQVEGAEWLMVLGPSGKGQAETVFLAW